MIRIVIPQSLKRGAVVSRFVMVGLVIAVAGFAIACEGGTAQESGIGSSVVAGENLVAVSPAEASDARDSVIEYLSAKAWGFFGATCNQWVEIDYEFSPDLSGRSSDGSVVVVFSHQAGREIGPAVLKFRVDESGGVKGENLLERSGIAEGCDQW